jgi:hypothetical protein
MGCF